MAFPSYEDRVVFHTPHLERVSRSFAFGISRLRPSLGASVGLGYLICRILDTIEDARWASHADQVRAFDEFDLFLNQGAAPEVVDAWASRFPMTISDGERELLEDAAAVFYEFANAPESEKSAMKNPIQSMSRGMRAYAERARETGELHLRDLTDASVYCFFVAGVVGELLEGLVRTQRDEHIQRPIGLNAIHFGLFLQKINVLKDQLGDEVEGRYLVPDRAEMLESLRENAVGAFEYLQGLELEKKDYRLFCAWALYVGLATVPLLKKAEINPKISRVSAVALATKLEFAIDDNGKLRSLFEDLVAAAWPEALQAHAAFEPERSEQDEAFAREMLERCYDGSIEKSKLAKFLSQSVKA